ncbi:DUF6318 family protein [Pauljensenia hongkongensis]|uniref:DUF6318 family protein n=1 Tax=Pauljensenia hongkongensis TaxID=178339 RepID=UPI001FE09D81|nr:DUF6318 family protein [Pauljensenia hongkongensis]
MNTDDEHAMDGTRPRAGLTRGRTAPGGAVDDPATNEPADASSLQDRSTGGPASSGFSIGDPDSDRTSPGGDQSVGDPGDDPDSGLPDGGPVDDGPADGGGGVSPVVREYVEGLRREALARDAELRARGIDPYKGTGVDEGPRRRLSARALVALIVLVVAAVSVGAYVVFLRGEPDYGMSHGYQVQSDGSLKRPSTPVHQPDAPAELLRFTDDASEIAATHYFEVVAYAWNTGDTQYLRAFSSPDCQFCKKTAEEIERLYTEGGWGSGAAYSNMTTEMLGKSEDAATFGDQSYGVRVRYHERTPDLYHDHSFQQSRESDNNLIVIVHWDGQRWLIRDIGKEGDE